MRENQLAAQVVNEVKKAVVGKDNVVVKTLIAILARGHVLLEDIPGVGKTTMAIAFSKALGLKYNRVQFTPDVMPSDLTGFSLYSKATGQMEYQPGALLCNLFLADELNRATSRTQSALLEAMEEGRVTVDGVSRPVPDPFLVIATQNPAGASGTQLLPDSQLDRFALRLTMGYPTPADELELLQRKMRGTVMESVSQAADRALLASLRDQADRVFVDDAILDYILRLVRATRDHPQLAQGASPRAAISLAVPTAHCGLLELRVDRAWACDHLGLFSLPVPLPPPARMVCRPIPAQVQPPRVPEGQGARTSPASASQAGPGEDYDLRDYRPGDPMRSVHWKLSSKWDELIVRERSETPVPLPLLTLDRFGPPEALDRLLDRLAGLSRALLDIQRPHGVLWLDRDGQPQLRVVSDEKQFNDCLLDLLGSFAPLRGPSLEEHPELLRGPDGPVFRIHVGQEGGNGHD